MGSDSSGRKSTENILLENILNTTQDCIFWKDVHRRFVGVNQAFLDYYGFESMAEILGKTDEDIGWHKNPQPFMEDEMRVLRGESTYMVHGKCIAHGEERDILASKRPLYDGDEIIGLVGSFVDVTENLKNQEEIRQLNQKLAKAFQSEVEINQMLLQFMVKMRLKMNHSIALISSLSEAGKKIEMTAQMEEDIKKLSAVNIYLNRLSQEIMDLEMIQMDGDKLVEKLKKMLHESQ